MDVIDLAIDPVTIPEGRLIAAKTYLIDRIVPACEVIVLPERTLPGGRLRVESGHVTLTPVKTRRLAKILPKSKETVPAGRWVFEMRLEDPENWAHFLNDHLPLFFKCAEMAGRDPAKALLLLPSDVPSYIIKAAAVFGLDCLATDAVVEGDGIDHLMEPRISNRCVRVDWARLPAMRAALETALATTPPSTELPRKVYLAREGRRAPSNSTELETFLADRGFTKIRPETLPALDQIRLFREAEDMVAISGAGMAPLLYVDPPEHGPRRIVEIQPCGHMASVYREMAFLVGCRFGAVRGRLKPEYVGPSYEFDTPFRKFSQDNFHVDLDALTMALEMTE